MHQKHALCNMWGAKVLCLWEVLLQLLHGLPGQHAACKSCTVEADQRCMPLVANMHIAHAGLHVHAANVRRCL